jgi:hypothetical protein
VGLFVQGGDHYGDHGQVLGAGNSPRRHGQRPRRESTAVVVRARISRSRMADWRLM